MQHNNQPANKRQPGGKVEKRQWRIARWRRRIKRTRGGGGAKIGATRNNQLANKRQTGGEASADRVRWSIERTRGSSGATRGDAITSGKMRVC